MRLLQKELKNWRFFGEKWGYLPCTVPASMYGVLLEHGKIEDPFYRLNEHAATAIAEDDCRFETVLSITPEELARERLVLRFEGIDTVAAIYLNGRRLAEVENMHRTFEFDIKDRVTVGENHLSVEISSPLQYMRKAQARHFVQGNADSIDGVAHIRKASYMMGWDWGPRLPDMGLWRPVRVLAFDTRIEDLAVRQKHRADGSVELDIRADISGDAADICRLVTLTAPDGSALEVALDEDGNGSLTVEKPALWWPNGYGEHPLYGLCLRLLRDGEELDRKELRLGLRTLTVSTAKDEWGNEFCLVVNGVKIFAMGADYIPEDNILSRRSRARSEKLLRECVAANFNTIRIWGGGVYPDDYFYDLCDELGIITWQDFMFGCINVWLREDFETNIRAEFADNLKRLRHHAALGLLCGNNEMEQFVIGAKQFKGELVREDYLKLYHHILPSICHELAPDVFYWPSSPASDQFFGGNPNDPNRGDVHFWDVGNGGKPISRYREHCFRFCSEFGFEALPHPRTVREFTAPEDRNPLSPVLISHQKCPVGTARILQYIAEHHYYPAALDGMIYASQLLQADAIRIAVEHMRRHRGRCMGATYWQLNDCWPVTSWASIDGAGRRKALHFAAADFFAPVLLSAHERGSRVTFNVSSEKRTPFAGKVEISLKKTDFSILSREVLDVELPALSARDIATRDFAEVPGFDPTDTFVEYKLYDARGALLSHALTLFVSPKYFHYKKPTFAWEIEGEAGHFTLHLTSDTFAQSVFADFENVDASFSRQFLHVTSEKGAQFKLTLADKSLTAAELEAQLQLFTVTDIAPDVYK